MRIDVDRDSHRMEVELDTLYARHFAGRDRRDRLGDPDGPDDGPIRQDRWAASDLVRLPAAIPPRFRAYRRIADGECYVYVEDILQQRLAGCTVFNRLVGIDRRLDPHLRSPHSRYRPAFQRRGLATAVYRQMLDAGVCLLSSARQSPAAHALWKSLGRRYELGYVRLEGGRVIALGDRVEDAVFDDLDTRLLLCGAGWDAARLAG